jgi:hypothetical protein
VTLPRPQLAVIDARRAVAVADYCVDVAGVGVTIRRGFETDGVSAPWLVRPWYPRFADEKYHGPALIHDALYSAQLTTRAEADRLFLEAMERTHAVWLKRHLAWAAVRIGGRRQWRRETPISIEHASKFVTVEDM